MEVLALSISTIKNWAIIENGIVVNKIIADEKFIKSQKFDAIDLTDLDHPNILDLWDGEKFIPKPQPLIDETLAE